MLGMTVRPLLARYVPPPAIVAGPFECRHKQEGIRLSFYLRHLGRDGGHDGFYRKRRNRERAYALGVVDEAMRHLWAPDGPHLSFVCNGNHWAIERIRVKAKTAPLDG